MTETKVTNFQLSQRLNELNFPDYEVYIDGKIYSHHSKRFVKGFLNNKGYLLVCLHNKGKKERFYIHRLVAQSFIDNPDKLPCVNHIDCNPLNNNVDNLEWCTHQQNIQHSYKLGRLQTFAPKKINQLTREGDFIKEFESVSEASRKLKIDIGDIVGVCKNSRGRKTAGGYRFEYK